MSYKQAMHWARKHPKGTRQPVLMSTGSGFWPSQSFLTEDYHPYLAACESVGIKPMECKAYYDATLRGRDMSLMSIEERVQRTKANTTATNPG